MTSEDPVREQLVRVWSGTLVGNESPERTIRPRTEETGSEPSPSSRTLSVLWPPGIETQELTGLAAPTPAAPAAAGGDRAGFEVLRTLGRGGMGVVYAARQGSLEREVAVKVPLDDPARQAAVEARFVSEALVTGDLDHPNIVPVHDLGRDDAGRLYMVMKLVRGTPWQRLLHPTEDDPEAVERAAGLGLRDHLEVLLKVADAVAFAHARGIVHRDLKPENVMVGAYGEVLVMDWGLALDVSPAGRTARKAQHRSEARGSAGTPSYMSPELALADYERIGVGSDVYLLGAILYELLTGGPPHVGRDVFEVLSAVARGIVQPPEERAPGRAVPGELSRIALRALHPDPAGRWADVPELQRALREYLSHEESLRLVDEGRARTARLSLPGAVPREGRYALYAEALAAFSQALHLWPENEEARAGRARAALDFTDEALDRGDVGLARAQLALVGDGAAEPARTAALRAAVAARSISWLRSRLGAAAVVALVAAGAWGLRAAKEELHARRQAEARQAARTSHLREAWSAARAGNLAAFDAARAAFRSAVTERGPEAEELLARLDWGRDVLLWQRGRWDDLGEALAPEGIEWRAPTGPSRRDRERGGPPPAGHAEVCRRLLARPEVTSSALAQAVADLCARSRAASAELAGLLREASRRGVGPAALAAAREELLAVDAAVRAQRRPHGPEGASPYGAGHFRLRLSGVFAPAVEAALRQGGSAAARPYERLLVPFRLSEPPLGEPLAPPRPAPHMVPRGDGVWAAVDLASGDERWRTTPLAHPGGTALPVEDGSVVIAAGSQVVRFDGATGAVLQRATLDGPVQLAWPDPDDRSRLELLVTTRDWEGSVHPLRLERGRLTPPVAEGSQMQSSFPTLAGAQALLSRLRTEAQAELGQQAPGVSARVLAGLREAASRDAHNADLWLAALQEAESDAATREEQAHAVVAARVAGPMDAVRLGVALERAGFRDLAQQLYERGAVRFIERHGNPDLVTPLGLTPALMLRKLGSELFDAGDTARALELVELGRRFSTFLDDDARFYGRYAAWLRRSGRPAEAAQMEVRAREAREVGGPLVGSGRVVAAVDTSVAVLPLATLLLGAVLLRGLLDSRRARHADLHARGWRSAGQRWAAFATHPLERLGFVFLAYLPRQERLAALLLAATVLASSAVTVGGLGRSTRRRPRRAA